MLAYQSGLLDDLPDGLIAARCVGITEPEAGTVCLWLEEVTDPFGAAQTRGLARLKTTSSLDCSAISMTLPTSS